MMGKEGKEEEVIWERFSTPQTTAGQKSECISMKILIWGEIGSNAYIGIRNAFKKYIVRIKNVSLFSHASAFCFSMSRSYS